MANWKHEWELPRFKEAHQLENGLEAPTDIYAVKFYPYAKPGVDPIFAVAGGPYVFVCRPQPDGPVEELLVIHDMDESTSQKEKGAYSLCWSKDLEHGTPLLVVSGSNGKILIIDATTGELRGTLIGHGGAINELVVCPTNPHIIASASDDFSVRIWSLDPKYAKRPCVAILKGERHCDIVETVAFHSGGRYVLSGGVDRTINLWAVPVFPDENTGTDKPTRIYYPHFSTSEIHDNCIVDCVAFHGDLILSKGDRENCIVLWSITNFSSSNPIPPSTSAPTSKGQTGDTRSVWCPPTSATPAYFRMIEFSTPSCEIFFMRFSLFSGTPTWSTSTSTSTSNSGPVLAICTGASKVLFWNLQRLSQHFDYFNQLPHTPGEEDMKRPAFLAKGQRRNRGGGVLGRVKQTSPTPSSLSNTSQSRDADIDDNTMTRWRKQYYLGDAQVPLVPHKEEMIKSFSFTGRQCAWSTGGEWCVAVGSGGVIAILYRSNKKAP